MHSPNSNHTRRAFLSSASLAGLAVWGGSDSLLGRALAQDEDNKADKKAPGSGPAGAWKTNSREVIQKVIMPHPVGSKLSDQIFLSKRLENVFYIDLGQHAILIDSGYDHQVDHHLDNFERMGCDLGKVVGILGTHFHVDHTGGVKRARERVGVPLVMHPRSVQPVSTGDLYVTAAIIPEVEGWEFKYPACPVDETVDEGDTIAVGDERFEVRHIPGHTPDSLGYIWRGHFFTGDAVFGGGNIGWANSRWFSNYADHEETMHRLIQNPPQAESFHASHGVELPYANSVPEASIKTLTAFQRRDDDPCNHTPKVKRRTADEPTRVLTLPV